MFEKDKYSKEVKQKYGNTESYKEYCEKTKNINRNKEELFNGINDIMKKFSICMNNGNIPGSFESQELVKMLKNYITNNFYNCTNEILLGLGQMYIFDKRFKENIDKYSIGTSNYIYESIKIYCNR